jgi:hypothetical protein
MGGDLLGFGPPDGLPQSTERSTAEIAAQRCNDLLRDPASDELQPELEFVEGVPERRPDSTPIPWSRASSPRLAHTLPRGRPSNGGPALAQSDVVTRPVLMLSALPLIEAPSNMPSPVEAPRNMPPLVAGPPKWPPAPRTVGDRLALPVMLLVLALGVGALFLLRYRYDL